MRTTLFMNLKGGTAKTVSCINTAAILSKIYSRSVLLIDADSQGNLSEFTAKHPDELPLTAGTAALLRGETAYPIDTKIPNVRLIAGDEDLLELDVSAVKHGLANPMAIADLVEELDQRDLFDHCLIDCPPAFSAAAMAALAAADEVVIPVKLDAFGIRGLSRLMAQIRNMQKINPDLAIAGVLPTMYYSNSQQRMAESDLAGSLEALGIRCFHHIRRSPSVDGSTFEQSPLVTFSPKSGACRDYKIFVRDLIGEEDERYGV